jgi:hypothetical protein
LAEITIRTEGDCPTKISHQPSGLSAAASAAVGNSCRFRPRSLVEVGAGTAAHAFTGLCSRESVDRADVDETKEGRFRTSAEPVGLTEGGSWTVVASPGAGDVESDAGGVGRTDHPPDTEAAGAVVVSFLVINREGVAGLSVAGRAIQ